MKNIFKECDLLITELYKFDESIISLGRPINDERLELFEKEIGFYLSLDFKYILKKHNRIVLAGTEIYGLDKELRGTSLDEVYQYEHNKEVFNAMPKEFLPFSPLLFLIGFLQVFQHLLIQKLVEVQREDLK